MYGRAWIGLATLMTCIGVLMIGWGTGSAQASQVVARVDLSQQVMRVYVNGRRKHTWRISSGKRGWETNPGSYTPYKMQKAYYSQKWNMSLPYLIWIGSDGTAVHGTTYQSRLGRPASHGCIRLSIANARRFYALVRRFGMYDTRVDVAR